MTRSQALAGSSGREDEPERASAPVPRHWAAKTTLCPLLPAQLANSCSLFKTHPIAICSARSFLAFPSHVPCGSHRAHLTCSPLQPSCQQSRPPGPRQQHSRSACVQSCSYPTPIQCMTPQHKGNHIIPRSKSCMLRGTQAPAMAHKALRDQAPGTPCSSCRPR